MLLSFPNDIKTVKAIGSIQTMYFSLGKEHREKKNQLCFEADKKLLETEFFEENFKYVKLPKNNIILLSR